MKLSKLTEKFSNEWEAVRAWHGGNGGRNRPHARAYEQIIRARIPQIAAAVPRVSSGAAPPELLASSFQPSAPKPVTLQSEEGTTPVQGGIDYETA